GNKNDNTANADGKTIKDTIRNYFDYSFPNDRSIELRETVNQCLDTFYNSPAFSSPRVMDELSDNFKESCVPSPPHPLPDYMNYLKEKVLPHTINVGKKRYVGHMTSQLPYFFQELSRLIVAMNQNVVKVETSKVLTLIERQVLGMMHRLVFELPEVFYRNNMQDRESGLGIVTSCGTLANITALWIARNRALQPSGQFLGLQSEGFANALIHYGFKDAVIIGSTKMHYSMDKLGSLIGLGAENILKIGLNDSGSIDLEKLEDTIVRCKRKKRLIVAIVGIAGTTETGQLDDLVTMADIAARHKIHFHADAAWGGPILFSDKNRHLLKGIEAADTVTICGHKQLYLPQGISMVMCKDPKIIYHIKATAGYQARSESFDLGKHSPEGSRPAVSLYLHAALHLLGKDGYAYLVDEGIRKALYFAQLIKDHEAFELIEKPDTNIVVYRYIPPEFRHKIADRSFTKEELYVINSVNEVLQDEQFTMGQSFISRTTLEQTAYGGNVPVVVLRGVIANPLTSEEDLKIVLDQQATIGETVKQRSMSFDQVLKLLYHQTSSYNRQ
ncbi:MAG: aminotransferase class V-fold PLP-dependent enzyme, partial [bacterium]|nr:aminotransferase class V-fold PLP-dependent enzyme [bacterium]